MAVSFFLDIDIFFRKGNLMKMSKKEINKVIKTGGNTHGFNRGMKTRFF